MDLSILATKLLPLLVYPLSLSMFCLVLAGLWAVRGSCRGAAGLVFLSLAILGISANSSVAIALFGGLEKRHPPLSVADTPGAEAIVVLGGGLGLPIAPRQHPDLVESSDRLLHAVRLYQAGKSATIILSGGNVFPQSTVDAESVYALELLTGWGVPRNAVLIEPASRNTYENALYTKALLAANGIGRVLLVTSAFHMPRSVEVFRGHGIDVVPVPADIRIVDYEHPSILDWIPSAGALATTTAALHEYLGILVYRLRGWIEGDS